MTDDRPSIADGIRYECPHCGGGILPPPAATPSMERTALEHARSLIEEVTRHHYVREDWYVQAQSFLDTWRSL